MSRRLLSCLSKNSQKLYLSGSVNVSRWDNSPVHCTTRNYGATGSNPNHRCYKLTKWRRAKKAPSDWTVGEICGRARLDSDTDWLARQGAQQQRAGDQNSSDQRLSIKTRHVSVGSPLPLGEWALPVVSSNCLSLY